MGNQQASDEVNEKIPKCLFVIGQQGCGKSTLIKRLTGVQNIDIQSQGTTVTKVIKDYQMQGPYKNWTVYDTPGINSLSDTGQKKWKDKNTNKVKFFEELREISQEKQMMAFCYILRASDPRLIDGTPDPQILFDLFAMKCLLANWHSEHCVFIFTHVDDFQKIKGRSWGGQDSYKVIEKLTSYVGIFKGLDITAIRSMPSSLENDRDTLEIENFKQMFIATVSGSRKILVDLADKRKVKQRIDSNMYLIPQNNQASKALHQEITIAIKNCFHRDSQVIKRVGDTLQHCKVGDLKIDDHVLSFNRQTCQTFWDRVVFCHDLSKDYGSQKSKHVTWHKLTIDCKTSQKVLVVSDFHYVYTKKQTSLSKEQSGEYTFQIASESAIGDSFLVNGQDLLEFQKDEAELVQNMSRGQVVEEGTLCNVEIWNDSSSTAVNVITLGNMIIANGIIASCQTYHSDVPLVNKYLPMVYRNFPNVSSQVARCVQPYFYDTDSLVSKTKSKILRSPFTDDQLKRF